MKRNLWSLLATLLMVSAALAGGISSSFTGSAVVANPLSTPYGTLFTDAGGSSLFVVRSGKIATLASAPGSGRYVTLSADGSRAGYKTITSDGAQVPFALDLVTDRSTPLNPPVRACGQVSFASDGRAAFTADDELVLTDGVSRSVIALGSYANIAPLSPDGRRVSYNDDDDQLWLLDLPTMAKTHITERGKGYWNPQWSPDSRHLLYSGLDGTGFVYDLSSGATIALGEAFAPSWSHDGRSIVFYRKEIRMLDLVNTDLYIVSWNGTSLSRLTATADLFETDPSFMTDDSGVLFAAVDRPEIYTAAFRDGRAALSAPRVMARWDRGFEEETRTVRPTSPMGAPTGTPAALDVPYVNQVYDTPDWFNGHWACGPTTAAMVLAYYDLLPPWDGWCSWPAPGHHNAYGRYVADQYYFRQRMYSWAANDPNGIPGWGGYGFMWTGSNSPHSTMAEYYTYHGLPASTIDGPTHASTVSELESGYPYSICVGLTTAGHIIAAHGIGDESHTLVVNDPYGNKNLPGYPNVHGKNAAYDWPGYNNGYQNLNEVYWGVSAHGTLVARADTLVDDLQFGHGFTLNTESPASMASWLDKNNGYKGHMWYAFTKAAGSSDTCFAVWQPNLPEAGSYEVLAYIAFSNATDARYRVTTTAGDTVVTVNQKAYRDTWISLGVFPFPSGAGASVRLGDADSVKGQEIVFDAIVWRRRASAAAEVRDTGTPRAYALEQNFPNPFNPSTRIRYSVQVTSRIVITVYSVLGQEVYRAAPRTVQPGTYDLIWDAQGFPSGIYIAVMDAYTPDGSAHTRLARVMTLLK